MLSTCIPMPAARITNNRATVTVFVTVWPLPLIFWPLGQYMSSDYIRPIQYMCVMFGVDSSSRFPLKARTNRQTRLNALPTPAVCSRRWIECRHLIGVITGGSRGAGGAMAPLAAWASTQNALKVAIFRLKIEKIFWGGGNAPSRDPS